MNFEADLIQTCKEIAQKGKGILAADESTNTIGKRFDAINTESTEANRQAYRQMLFTAPGMENHISGVILFEETLFQKTDDDVPFPKLLASKGVVPGIKIDKGLVDLALTDEEKITQGLDGLPERLAEYKKAGARFAKWRAVYNITDAKPSSAAIESNAECLARYAAICQEQGIVPIVEPEVLINGEHSIEVCEEVTDFVLAAVFNQLGIHNVLLEGMILKPSMTISGDTCTDRAPAQEVATATVRTLKRTVPAAVPTINFLSGGQTSEESTLHLDLMNKAGNLPWNVSFSYGRALQADALKAWGGKPENLKAGQAAFMKRAKLNGLAAKGEYSEAMEKETVTA
jgi:fructose-bisphosphate aldolase, class I